MKRPIHYSPNPTVTADKSLYYFPRVLFRGEGGGTIAGRRVSELQIQEKCPIVQPHRGEDFIFNRSPFWSELSDNGEKPVLHWSITSFMSSTLKRMCSSLSWLTDVFCGCSQHLTKGALEMLSQQPLWTCLCPQHPQVLGTVSTPRSPQVPPGQFFMGLNWFHW